MCMYCNHSLRTQKVKPNHLAHRLPPPFLPNSLIAPLPTKLPTKYLKIAQAKELTTRAPRSENARRHHDVRRP